MEPRGKFSRTILDRWHTASLVLFVCLWDEWINVVLLMLTGQWQHSFLHQCCQELWADWFCKDAVCSDLPELVAGNICMCCQSVIVLKLSAEQLLSLRRQKVQSLQFRWLYCRIKKTCVIWCDNTVVLLLSVSV